MKWLFSITLFAVLSGTTVSRNAEWRDDWTIWNDSISRSPSKARAYNELGLHLLEQKRYDDALRYLGRSIQMNPYQTQVYVNIGLAYERLGRPDKAREIYERAIWASPADPTAYYNLGVLYYTVLNDHDKAFRYFVQARDRNPGEPDVQNYLASLYEEKGDLARAREARDLHDRLRHR